LEDLRKVLGAETKKFSMKKGNRRVRDLEANILIWAMRFENTILKFGIKK